MAFPYKKDIYESIDAEDKEEGDSLLYVGIRFLKLVAEKMKKIEEITGEAWINKGDTCMLWLYELRGFYDLIESRTGLKNSDKKIKISKYEYNKKIESYEKIETEITEKEKYDVYFDEIEKMIERAQKMINVGGETKINRYNKDKEVLKELSKCTRELFSDANKLIPHEESVTVLRVISLSPELNSVDIAVLLLITVLSIILLLFDEETQIPGCLF